MLTSTNKFSIALIISFAITANVLPQEKKIYKGEVQETLQRDEYNISPERNQTTTQAMIEFEKRMKAAKESGNKNELANIENEIDNVMGTKTMKLKKNENIKVVSEAQSNTRDNYQNGNVAPGSYGYCVATCTEQTGVHTGRIWALLNTDYTKYSLYFRINYSDDNGLTWNNYLTFYYQSPVPNYASGLYDAEIIENGVNKFLWFVNGVNTLGIVNLNNQASAFYDMEWPSNNTPTNYNLFSQTRMVSDNSYYANTPYVYFVTLQDSNDANNFANFKGERTAICLNPYTINPGITYKTSAIKNLHPEGGEYSCDIAYYRNGGSDSIIFVECGLTADYAINLYRVSIFSYLNNVQFVGNLNFGFDERNNGRVATNGAYNQIMITNMKKYSFSDWDVQYHRSTNGSAGWSGGYLDFSTSNATVYSLDLTAKRNDPGNFSATFLFDYPYEIAFSHAINNTWGPLIHPINNMPIGNSFPKAGVNLGAGFNSSIVFWDQEYNDIWATSGYETFKKLILYGAIQGMYNTVSDTEVPDTIKVCLRNSVSPYNAIDSSKNILLGPGTGQEFIFTNAFNGTPYYVQVNHRNALETWSADPVTFVNDETSIAFSVSQVYAYGNNEIQVDTSPYVIFAFYSGDENRDGIIDISDIIDIFNDAAMGVSGYVKTDLTGDDFVDLSDLLLAYNNSNNMVSVIRP